MGGAGESLTNKCVTSCVHLDQSEEYSRSMDCSYT
jgi:hypothetical protein